MTAAGGAICYPVHMFLPGPSRSLRPALLALALIVGLSPAGAWAEPGQADGPVAPKETFNPALDDPAAPHPVMTPAPAPLPETTPAMRARPWTFAGHLFLLGGLVVTGLGMLGSVCITPDSAVGGALGCGGPLGLTVLGLGALSVTTSLVSYTIAMGKRWGWPGTLAGVGLLVAGTRGCGRCGGALEGRADGAVVGAEQAWGRRQHTA